MLICYHIKYAKAVLMIRRTYMSKNEEEIEKILREIKKSKAQKESSDENIEKNTSVQDTVSESKTDDEKIMGEQVQKAEEEPENAEPEKLFSVEEQSAKPVQIQNEEAEYEEYEDERGGSSMNDKKKKIIIIVAAVVAVIAIAAGVYFGVFYNKEEPTTTAPITTEATTAAPVVIKNPLTGEAEYNEAAVGKRPVAVVVENSPQARPQYNMDTPDIIVEGEVEGGITRMLWLYADMTDLPEQVGPTRSARPSFVEFSQFFDSVFIHFGESHSKGSYVGADDYIADNDVDNIDGMSTSSCFKRTSDKSSPHNAVLVGGKLVEAIEKKEIRTDIENSSFTSLTFNDAVTAVSSTPCNKITTKISSRTSSHTFTYDSADMKYKNQSDFEQEVSFTNIIVLYTDTEYVVKNDYKSSGNSETYCNFNFNSGTGKLASAGTVVDFNWKNNNGVLEFTDAATGKPLSFNPGNSWLGITSSNNGGSATVE